MDEKKKPLLDLNTIIERPKIKIDGRICEIVSHEELPILTSQKVASDSRRLDELHMSDTLDDVGQQELTKLIYQVSDTIMAPVPEDLREKLTEMQRLDIIQAFGTLLMKKKAGTAAAMLASMFPEMSEIGEKLSHASNGSTEAALATGLRKRR